MLSRYVPEPATFATEHWGRSPLLHRGADPGAFRDLLDLDGVDELLSRRGLRTPFLRVVRDGEVLSSAAFTGSGGPGATIGDQVRDDRVAALFADGATIVLQGLHRTWPPIIDHVTRLTEELGHPVQANAYITPPSSRGFAAHYDVHDVFVLQLAGRKRWTVHPPVHRDPLRDQPWNRYAHAVARRTRDDPPAIDTVLEPGDVIYLPRGWLHAATALGQVSAHLTLGVHVVTRYALVEALAALVAEDEELRASLPLGIDVSDPNALAGHLQEVRSILVAALQSISAERVARHLRRRVWSGARPEPLAPLSVTAFADGLTTGDTVRRRVGLRYRIRQDGDRVVVELPDREIALPAGTDDGVRALMSGAVCTVGKLPGPADTTAQVDLVRRLLREGLLVPATVP